MQETILNARYCKGLINEEGVWLSVKVRVHIILLMVITFYLFIMGVDIFNDTSGIFTDNIYPTLNDGVFYYSRIARNMILQWI